LALEVLHVSEASGGYPIDEIGYRHWSTKTARAVRGRRCNQL